MNEKLKKVIWLENDPLGLKEYVILFHKFLKEKGIDVVIDEVFSGEKLLNYVLRNGYDLVLASDYDLNCLNTLDIIRKIREHEEKSTIPIYMMSLKETIEKDAMESGATGYINILSPFFTSEIKRVLVEHLQ